MPLWQKAVCKLKHCWSLADYENAEWNVQLSLTCLFSLCLGRNAGLCWIPDRSQISGQMNVGVFWKNTQRMSCKEEQHNGICRHWTVMLSADAREGLIGPTFFGTSTTILLKLTRLIKLRKHVPAQTSVMYWCTKPECDSRSTNTQITHASWPH